MEESRCCVKTSLHLHLSEKEWTELYITLIRVKEEEEWTPPIRNENE